MIIRINFYSYPIDESTIVDGTADVSLDDRIPIIDEKTQCALIPIERPLRWTIVNYTTIHEDDMSKIKRDDLIRWLTGRYCYLIESRFYLEMAKKHALHKLESFYAYVSNKGINDLSRKVNG